MKDLWHTLASFLDKYRYTAIALVFSAILLGALAGTVGCHSKTLSVLNPSAWVTRPALDREVIEVERQLAQDKAILDAQVAEYNARVAARNRAIEQGYADLDRQDQFKAEFLDTVGITAGQIAAGALNPAALIPLAVGISGGLLGLGASRDSRRKDGVISSQKLEIAKNSA